MSGILNQEAGLPEQTYVQLIRDLFHTLLPTVIMAVCFTVVGLLVISEKPDPLLIALSVLATITVLGRIGVLLYYRSDGGDAALAGARARRMEAHFRSAYLGFAACFGSFSAAAYIESSTDIQTLLVALVFGYGAGVVAGLSVRPRISIPAITIATVPMIFATIHELRLTSLVLSFLLSVFLAGGVHAIITRYRQVSTRISTIGTFGSLARHDHLTGLGNRLALREAFETYLSAPGDGGVAVHCLDLDRFKPVNDLYGHPVGDALLVAVAARLRNVLRKSDFVARLGGDEFIVVQMQVHCVAEVEILARRIVRDVTQPYIIEGNEISIGTSVGYVFSSKHGNLEDLITSADEALYHAKRLGGGVASYEAAGVNNRDGHSEIIAARR